jgi:hypothetical protein
VVFFELAHSGFRVVCLSAFRTELLPTQSLQSSYGERMMRPTSFLFQMLSEGDQDQGSPFIWPLPKVGIRSGEYILKHDRAPLIFKLGSDCLCKLPDRSLPWALIVTVLGKLTPFACSRISSAISSAFLRLTVP